MRTYIVIVKFGLVAMTVSSVVACKQRNATASGLESNYQSDTLKRALPYLGFYSIYPTDAQFVPDEKMPAGYAQISLSKNPRRLPFTPATDIINFNRLWYGSNASPDNPYGDPAQQRSDLAAYGIDREISSQIGQRDIVATGTNIKLRTAVYHGRDLEQRGSHTLTMRDNGVIAWVEESPATGYSNTRATANTRSYFLLVPREQLSREHP